MLYVKKIIITVFVLLCTAILTSCDSYAQVVVYDDFSYEYSYNTYPVRYINGMYYYYAPYGYSWRWVVLDRMYYSRVIHHPRPVWYRHPRPYYWYRYARPSRPYNPGGQYRRPMPERRSDFGGMKQNRRR